MANDFSRGLRRFRSRASGFSLSEALVSLTIIGILSVTMVLNLNSSKRVEELGAAARVVAADLRSMQARALAGQNVKTCAKAGPTVVCESSDAICDPLGPLNPCTPTPAFSYGMHLTPGTSVYNAFSDVNAATKDWIETPGAYETVSTRDVTKNGGSNVTIFSLGAGISDAHVSFERQNGRMHIVCTPACAGTDLTITLRHEQSLATRQITLRAATGRISVE